MPHAPGIEFQRVTLSYQADTGETLALAGLGFSVAPGQSVALIGPSGCGKSSALHLIAGLVRPSEGAVLVDGAPVARPRRTTALIPQQLGLFPWKTVLQNAAVGLSVRGVARREAAERARSALAEVGLSGFEQAYPRQLSGGMQQRLALARALALDVDLLLMDEPLSAIDALLREQLQEQLVQLWRKTGHTQVMVTHSIEEAVYLGQRIIVLSGRPGSVVADIANPQAATQEWRDSAAFAAQCKQVRAALMGCGEGGAHD
ncbi:ABC transporter ATP-binding protein [Berryella wangjianweii]|uniref:ABC transporter ATP-binding protein n=1 Tax=Berryella wangjianweii TaxID=2734634 RepID=UPI0021BD7CD2|nr:ABC transporter ATP-binding protein [Berryella wangjianweii]